MSLTLHSDTFQTNCKVMCQDQLLLQSVEQFGRNWKTIVDNNFTGRTAISAKNRYSVLTRKMRDQGSRQASKRPSNSRCSQNSSSRNNRATISQKSASSEQLDSDDDMNDLDADASTDDDMTQFAESNQAADEVFGKTSIYPKTSSCLIVSKKSHNLPSPQKPTYSSMPSSHDTSGKLHDKTSRLCLLMPRRERCFGERIPI